MHPLPLVMALSLLGEPASLMKTASAHLLKNGDRIALVGGALIEQEQRMGFWETLLTLSNPGLQFRLRNLGWSGDTVWGDARAGFGTQADGYKLLLSQIKAANPTVVLLAYGGNEAFDGQPGLVRFREGLGRLVDDLAPLKARIFLVLPYHHEYRDSLLPDPKRTNEKIDVYRKAIQDFAGARKMPVLDPLGIKPQWPGPITENGMHLSDLGYWLTAPAFCRGLAGAPPPAMPTTVISARGRMLPFRLDIKELTLPVPLPPAPRVGAGPAVGRLLRITDLPPGNYRLLVDHLAVAEAPAAAWQAGIILPRGPEWDQAEELRQAIVAKNTLYFNRYRPQNETYLFGFRKHEQGQNAKEMPQFDPLVAKEEARIDELKKPRPHDYELQRLFR